MATGTEPAGPPKTNVALARWDGGWRARVAVGAVDPSTGDPAGFELLVDEPTWVDGGTGSGPQPTDYLMASIASCYALAVSWAARKRGVELPDVAVRATGTYDGPKFSHVLLTVTSTLPADQLEPLLEPARRACYVSNTIALAPPIEVELG
jgi:putative redox protein